MVFRSAYKYWLFRWALPVADVLYGLGWAPELLVSLYHTQWRIASLELHMDAPIESSIDLPVLSSHHHPPTPLANPSSVT